MPYKVQNNKIFIEAVEINVTNRCNLSCRGCSHLSPLCKSDEFDTNQLEYAINKLSTVCHFDTVRLLGGEPFLSKSLRDIIKITKNSGVSDKVIIVSNGLLLNEEHAEILEQVDKLRISAHTNNLDIEKIKKLTHKRCDLEIMFFDLFRESYSEQGTKDVELITSISDTCMIGHVWSCYNLEQGVFYKCPQAHCFKPYFKDLKSDGIDIVRSNCLEHDIKSYIDDKTPLSACKYCLGSVGKLFAQKQINRRDWRKKQDYLTEQMIDYDFLEKLKVKKDSNFGCVLKTIYIGKNER